MKIYKKLSTLIIIITFLSSICHGFYLPGLAPVNYCRKSESNGQCKVSSIEKTTLNIFFFFFLVKFG